MIQRHVAFLGFSILAAASLMGCASFSAVGILDHPPIAPDFVYHPHGAVTTAAPKYSASVSPVDVKSLTDPEMPKGQLIDLNAFVRHQDFMTLWTPENFSRLLAQDLAGSALFKSVAVQEAGGSGDGAGIVIKPAFFHAFHPDGSGRNFGGWLSVEVYRGKNLLLKKIYHRDEGGVKNERVEYNGRRVEFENPFSEKGSLLDMNLNYADFNPPVQKMSTEQWMDAFTGNLMDDIRKDLAVALGVPGAAKSAAHEADDNMVH